MRHRDRLVALLREHRAAVVAVTLVVAAAVVFVAASLRRPTLDTFAPTPPDPREVGAGLAGPSVFTVDATDSDRWVHFDFSRGSVVENPGPLDWDLAFRRFHVIVNGGDGFAGRGGIRDLGDVPFDSVDAVPVTGYLPTRVRSDSTHPAMDGWYDYSWLSHVLTPAPRSYAVRTADGRYAKLRIVGYYCPGARPGCLTFRWAYRGDGSPLLRDPDPDPRSP